MISNTSRLTQKQKIILNSFCNIGNIDVFKKLVPKDMPTFANIDINNSAKYFKFHNKITILLQENNIEPHEIFRMINTYIGSNVNCIDFKKLIMARNICIIKKIYNTSEWISYINNIIKTVKSKYALKNTQKELYENIDKSLISILDKEIATYDILQHKINVDSHNLFKRIVLSMEDYNKILSKLLDINKNN